MKKILITILVLSIIGILYYLISPLFITKTANEEMPSLVINEEIAEYIGVQIQGTKGHRAEGIVKIISDDEKKYVRYENLKMVNGPDIYVYLSKDLDAKEFINLGKVRATEGNINYEIPANVDISEYDYVIVWCKMFGVLFNYADISNI